MAEEFATTIDQELTKGKSSSQEKTATSDIRAWIPKLQRDIQSYTKESPIKASLALAITAIAVVAIGLTATKQTRANSWEEIDTICRKYRERATHHVEPVNNQGRILGYDLLALAGYDLLDPSRSTTQNANYYIIKEGDKISAFLLSYSTRNSPSGEELAECERMVPGLGVDALGGWFWVGDSEKTLLPQDRKLDLHWIQLDKPLSLTGNNNTTFEVIHHHDRRPIARSEGLTPEEARIKIPDYIELIESSSRMIMYNQNKKPTYASPWRKTKQLTASIEYSNKIEAQRYKLQQN